MNRSGLRESGYWAGVLVGVDIYDPKNLRRGNENAAFLLAPDLAIAHHYVKHHLVPFGEYVPLRLDEVLPIGNIVGRHLRPGHRPQPGGAPSPRAAHRSSWASRSASTPSSPRSRRSYARSGAEVLVNMTNDAWYGFSSAPFQFLRMVAIRAVETGRPVARAANTGISAFIDPVGRIQQATEVGIVPSDSLQLSASELTGPEWRMAELPLLTGSPPTL